MSTSVNAFVGRNCPLCGAIDSLDTDEARGEVACTECACVIAMGLGETEQNRYVGDATFEDVDRKGGGGKDDGKHGAVSGSAAVTRSQAVALATGAARAKPTKPASTNERVRRHPLETRMMDLIDALCRLIKAAESVRYKAGELLRDFLSWCSKNSKSVEPMQETAAACFLLASEMHRRPVPMPELRRIAPSLKDVEGRRREIVRVLGLEEQESQLRQDFLPNLLQLYIRLLHAQMAKYERACRALAAAIKTAANTSGSRDLANLSEVDRCVAAVLLARTSPEVVWEDKPKYDPAHEPPLLTAYDSFAASANLNAPQVRRVMAAVTAQLQLIVPLFEKVMAPTSNSTATAAVKTEGEKPSLKREREEES